MFPGPSSGSQTIAVLLTYSPGPSTTGSVGKLRMQGNQVFRHAVINMLPRGTLGRQQINKLKVYKGDKHPHAAQQCKNLEIK